MKRIILPTLILMLAACGKGPDDYVGYWQREGEKDLGFIQIKKESGSYFLIQGGKNKVLSEKDGVLTDGGGFGERPLKLSDDGKKIFANLYAAGSNTFRKVEGADCEKLAAEYVDKMQTTNAYSLSEIKEAQKVFREIEGRYTASGCDKG